MIKYFYESKRKKLNYESYDKYEVADWLIQTTAERDTPEKVEIYYEILAIIAEKYVNEVEEEKETETNKFCEELDEEYDKHKEDYLIN